MVRLNRIYTRTGDDGTSGLVDGSRLSKSDALFDAIGDVDEANSVIGIVVAVLAADDPLATRLRVIQNDLFDLGADLATPALEGDAPFAPGAMQLRIEPGQVSRVEAEIDGINEKLAALTSFILPGGNQAAAFLHVARTVVRRAERSAVAAAAERRLNPAAIAYINRLSDWLFVAARSVAARDGGEILWVPGSSRDAMQ